MRLLNDFLRVNVSPIHPKLEVQMGSGGPTCGAHCTNGLPLLDRLAFADLNLAQVSINRGVVVAMTNDHDIAKATLNTRKLNNTIANSLSGRACWGSVVNAQVRFHGLEYGVQSHGEAPGLA